MFTSFIYLFFCLHTSVESVLLVLCFSILVVGLNLFQSNFVVYFVIHHHHSLSPLPLVPTTPFVPLLPSQRARTPPSFAVAVSIHLDDHNKPTFALDLDESRPVSSHCCYTSCYTTLSALESHSVIIKKKVPGFKRGVIGVINSPLTTIHTYTHHPTTHTPHHRRRCSFPNPTYPSTHLPVPAYPPPSSSSL